MPPLPCALGFGVRVSCPATRQCPWSLPRPLVQIPLSPTVWSVGAGDAAGIFPCVPRCFGLSCCLCFTTGKVFKSSLCSSGMDPGRADFKQGRGFSLGAAVAGFSVPLPRVAALALAAGRGHRDMLCATPSQPLSQPLPSHHRPTQKSHHY